MIMARTVIQTKWGKADEVVKAMKEMMGSGPAPEGSGRSTLMTDLGMKEKFWVLSSEC